MWICVFNKNTLIDRRKLSLRSFLLNNSFKLKCQFYFERDGEKLFFFRSYLCQIELHGYLIKLTLSHIIKIKTKINQWISLCKTRTSYFFFFLSSFLYNQIHFNSYFNAVLMQRKCSKFTVHSFVRLVLFYQMLVSRGGNDLSLICRLFLYFVKL